MILRLAPLAALLLASACAVPPTPVETAAETGCDLTVGFASIGTGIDSSALQKVDALLAADGGVDTVDRQRWGREGEITLCVDTRSEADANRLFGAVKSLFPASSEKPLSVETSSGRSYRVPAP